MISNPQNDFERLQNAIATQLQAQSTFSSLKLPDGTPWLALTEDEGDINFLFEKMIADCGLAVIVQSPTGKAVKQFQNLPGPRFAATIPIQISEAMLFNRGERGTGVNVQTAASVVRRSLHLFTPTGIAGAKAPLQFVEALKDRDRHPETGALVVSVVCVFETPLNEQSLTIT